MSHEDLLRTHIADLEIKLAGLQWTEQINRTLLQFLSGAGAARELPDLFELINHTLSTIIDTSNFFIALYQRAHDRLIFPYVVDEEHNSYPPIDNASKTFSLTAEVIRTGKPLFITKKEMIARRAQSVFMAPPSSLSEVWLGVPLKVQDNIIGVMAVQSYNEPTRYSKTALDLLMAVAGHIAMAIDRTCAEEALRESEERYAAVVKQASEGIYLLDPFNKRVLEANTSFLKMIGRSEDELDQLFVYDFVAHQEHEIDRVIEQIIARKNNLSGKSDIVGERTYLKRDGSLVYVDSKVTVLNYNGKDILCVIVRDITEHKQRAEALCEGELKYRRLVENATDAVYLVDGDGTILSVNPAACRTLGYTKEELTGMTVVDISPDIDDMKFQSFFDGLSDEKPCLLLSRHRRKDGHLLPVEINIFAYRQQGSRYLLAMARDISRRTQDQEAREHLESQLKQSQKMQSIAQFAEGIAHDYNSMLDVILGRTEFALEETDKENGIYEDLMQIRDAALYSVKLTRQLSAFAGKRTTNSMVLNLNETITAMAAMLQRLIGNDITLTLHPAHDLWPVNIDSIQIQRIVTNLCLNSRDAITHRNGTITISTENSSYANTGDKNPPNKIFGEFVKLSLTDNGAGISSTDLPKVFTPFFTTKKPGRGTGLGLATVSGIVKQCKGFIEVVSNAGKGTTFVLYLPRHWHNCHPSPPTTRTPHHTSHKEALPIGGKKPTRRPSVQPDRRPA